MLAAAIAVFAAVLLVPFAQAQTTDLSYNVHGVVSFVVPGERTPLLGGMSPERLTALGATQLYAQGQYFRERYVQTDSNDNDTAISKVISGINMYTPDDSQLYVMAVDEWYIAGGATAFLQGLYPPFTLNNSSPPLLDNDKVLSNGSYIEAPLNGYQYPLIQTVSNLDPNLAFISGHTTCPNWAYAASSYLETNEFATIQAQSAPVYQRIGAETLTDVLPPDVWGYSLASPIYEYVAYQAAHNGTVASIVNDNSTSPTYLEQLRNLASMYAWATASPDLNTTVNGEQSNDVLPIAGQTLAAKILYLLNATVASQGESPKLSVIFADSTPLLSFAAVSGLANWDADFASLPEPGSAIAFELFSVSSSSNLSAGFPSEDELFVRFSFKNGTGVTVTSTSDAAAPTPSTLQAYPLFELGPSKTDLQWTEFVQLMGGIVVPDAGEWCTTCGAVSVWCPAFADASGDLDSDSSTDGGDGGRVTPQVAGVIGAACTLVVLIIAIIVATLCGLRVTRAGPDKRLSGATLAGAGGFKGADKLESDRDVADGKGARERVGSWELNSRAGVVSTPALGDRGGMALGKETGLAALGKDMGRRPSFEDDNIAGMRPVTPRYSV